MGGLVGGGSSESGRGDASAYEKDRTFEETEPVASLLRHEYIKTCLSHFAGLCPFVEPSRSLPMSFECCLHLGMQANREKVGAFACADAVDAAEAE